MLHEIMHALGVHHKPVIDAFMSANNSPELENPVTQLESVDREALRVLYSRLESGADPLDFGPWASMSLHVHGNGPHAGFGVALRNGYAEPWAYGYLPETDLADNPVLSGNATWTGELLGLTPQGEAVAGDATISVEFATLTGHADFTALESWSAGVAPGYASTGATWGDGDLGYTIVVNGNTFGKTGGDDGTLTGIFVGRQHEGAAGTLERPDLTAAFGAVR